MASFTSGLPTAACPAALASPCIDLTFQQSSLSSHQLLTRRDFIFRRHNGSSAEVGHDWTACGGLKAATYNANVP
jgi:hypothetical protein